MRQFITVVDLVLALTLGTTTATAAPIMIDDFGVVNTSGGGSPTLFIANGTNQPSLTTFQNAGILAPVQGFQANSANPAFNVATSLTVTETGLPPVDVLGGKRITTLNFSNISSGSGELKVRIDPVSHILLYSADANVKGSLSLLYDYGVLGKNFSGQSGVNLLFNSNSANGLVVTMTVTDGGTFSSSQTLNTFAGPGASNLFFPFNSGTNLSAITSIKFDLQPQLAGQNFALDDIFTIQVPEPTTIAICGIFGVAGLIGVRRKLKKAAEPNVAV